MAALPTPGIQAHEVVSSTDNAPHATTVQKPAPLPAITTGSAQPSSTGLRKKKKKKRSKAPPPPPVKKSPSIPAGALVAAGVVGGSLAVFGLVQLFRKLFKRNNAAGDGSNAAPCANFKPSAKCVALADGSACVVRRQIPADNSCLFNAVAYCMHGSKQKAAFLRGVVAREVSSDTETYSAAFLGMSNAAYCNWIVQPHNWGGGIELAILARHYGREIGAWNIESGKQHVFGEEAGYPKAVMLIYTGTHYDALAIAKHPRAPESEDKTEFNPRTKAGKMAIAAAQKLVQLSHKGPRGKGPKLAPNASPSVTPRTPVSKLPAKRLLSPVKGNSPTTNGTEPQQQAGEQQAGGRKTPHSSAGGLTRLKCEDCGVVCVGQRGAARHAESTGHSRFTQVALSAANAAATAPEVEGVATAAGVVQAGSAGAKAEAQEVAEAGGTKTETVSEGTTAAAVVAGAGI